MAVGGLRAENLMLAYADGPVLGPLDLAIGPGERAAIVGPSGCGKSTLLACFAGLLAPTAGTATAQGALGVVFQDPTLLPWLSILDNVALPLSLRGDRKAEGRERAHAALAQVGLEGRAGALPRALSGGMRMRAALARALVAQPEILLLDEPFGAIDEFGRRQLDELVLSIADAKRLCVLFITHSIEEAVLIADRVVVLGRRPGHVIAEIATPTGARDDALLASPDFVDAAARVRAALRAETAL